MGAVAALAIGIGANLTIFGFANALLFRPLPAPESQELVRVSMYRWSNVPYEHYLQYREQNRTLSGLAAFQNAGASLQAGGPPEIAAAMVVSGNYFEVLRIGAAVGRTIGETDDRPNAPPVLMLSDTFWRRRFGADPAIIGLVVTVDGRPFTIVGVTPASFKGTLSPVIPQLWIPWNAPHGDLPPSAGLVGRMRRDVPLAQVQADLATIAAAIAREINERFYLTVSAARVAHPELVLPVAAFAGTLMALATLVLLIACFNIASLLLARSTSRRKEIGVRIALGASRTQLVRQLLTESLLLSFAGGLAGLGVAFWTGKALAALPLPGLAPSTSAPPPMLLDFVLDWNVVLVGAGISIGTALLFGLAPALQAVKVNIAPALKDTSATAAVKRSRLRASFVVGQLAVSAFLLVVAALLVRSLTSEQTINRGFNADSVLTAGMTLVNAGYTKPRGIEFYRRLQQRLESTPGIESVNIAEIVPLTASNSGGSYHIEGGSDVSASDNVVSRGHFRTLGIPLLAGRDFTDEDREGSTPVCIINERMAQRLWPGQNPLGKRLRSGKLPWVEVIGVAANSKYVGLVESPKIVHLSSDRTALRPAPDIGGTHQDRNRTHERSSGAAGGGKRTRSRRPDLCDQSTDPGHRDHTPADENRELACQHSGNRGASARRDRHLWRGLLPRAKPDPRNRHPRCAGRQTGAGKTVRHGRSHEMDGDRHPSRFRRGARHHAVDRRPDLWRGAGRSGFVWRHRRPFVHDGVHCLLVSSASRNQGRPDCRAERRVRNEGNDSRPDARRRSCHRLLPCSGVVFSIRGRGGAPCAERSGETKGTAFLVSHAEYSLRLRSVRF